MTDWRNISKAEQLKFYKQCKELYYATGESPLEDFEFDELQKILGLENKDNTPTRRNPKYVVEHPVKMGSLSKVQIKKSNDGSIDWYGYLNDINKFICKNSSNPNLIITPKFDGCSFEIKRSEYGVITDISGRGDGEFGPNYYDKLINICSKALSNINMNLPITFRGEVLIDKKIFLNKYSILVDEENGFINPRSFVAGILGRDYDAKDSKYLEMLNDLSIVIYDIKVNNGNWDDIDWTVFNEDPMSQESMAWGYIPSEYLPNFYKRFVQINNPSDLENIYNEFNDYRINKCPFALDGIVIKPIEGQRKYNNKDYRPKDCVAVKFIPQLQETEVVDISWKLGEKSGDLVPTIVTNPVEMDGKQVTRAAASNYGKLINKKISIGTKVILSLAGDIIPFIYKIVDTSKFDENNLNIPTQYETYIQEGGIDKDGNKVIRLKAILSEEDRRRMNFMVSSKVLNIANLGPALTEVVYNYLVEQNNLDETDDFFGITTKKPIPSNILLVSPSDIYMAIGGKNGEKIRKEFEKVIKNITLKEIIQSCNFKLCGEKVAEQCANYLSGMEYDFSHLAKEGYEWTGINEKSINGDNVSNNIEKLRDIVNHFGKTFTDYKVVKSKEQIAFENEQIPVILTGEPNDYASKAEFLRLHPEYRQTGKWTEVKIVFTNSLESNTGKMKKAREKNIELRLY